MHSRNPIIILLLLTILFAGAEISYSDVYWESDQLLRVPGRADRHKTVRNYFTPTACRVDIGENITIADFGAMTGYVANSIDRMYFKVDMYNEGIVDPSLSREIEAVPTDEVKHIAGYKCRKYMVTVMGRTYEEWLSKEVPAYQELRSVNESLTPFMRQHPLFQMSIVGRMHKLDGFPVMTVMPLDGDTVRIVTLRKVSTGPISREVFKAPKGYRTP